MEDGQSKGGISAGPEDSGPSLSPLRAFVLLVVVAVVGGAVLITSSSVEEGSPQISLSPIATDSGVRPSPTQAEPDGVVPAEAEALEVYADLQRGLERAYRNRDIGLLRRYVQPGSPQFRRSSADIRFLLRRGLLDRTRRRTLEVEIESAAPARIVVGERARIRPRYLDEATYTGIDVDVVGGVYAFRWVVERAGGTWRIVASAQARP